jgi:outer membrane protein assembly factor BamB
LIALLGQARLPIAWQAEALLTAIAGAKRPAAILQGSAASRQACRTPWEKWWQAESARLDLSRVRWPEEDRGSILVADLDEGRLLNHGLDYKLRWQMEGAVGPLDVQLLPSGRLLVAENHTGVVSERDRSGKVVWEKNLAAATGPEASLVGSCRRLADGKTLIATPRELLAVDAEGKLRWSAQCNGYLWSLRRLRDGRLIGLAANPDFKPEEAARVPANHVILFSAEGKELGRFPQEVLGPCWSSLTVIPNGHVLVPTTGPLENKVAEFTLSGEKVWECEAPGPVCCAARLANGHTLLAVSYDSKVIEVDRAGKVVHELMTEGRPWSIQVVP